MQRVVKETIIEQSLETDQTNDRSMHQRNGSELVHVVDALLGEVTLDDVLRSDEASVLVHALERERF